MITQVEHNLILLSIVWGMVVVEFMKSGRALVLGLPSHWSIDRHSATLHILWVCLTFAMLLQAWEGLYRFQALLDDRILSILLFAIDPFLFLVLGSALLLEFVNGRGANLVFRSRLRTVYLCSFVIVLKLSFNAALGTNLSWAWLVRGLALLVLGYAWVRSSPGAVRWPDERFHYVIWSSLLVLFLAFAAYVMISAPSPDPTSKAAAPSAATTVFGFIVIGAILLYFVCWTWITSRLKPVESLRITALHASACATIGQLVTTSQKKRLEVCSARVKKIMKRVNTEQEAIKAEAKIPANLRSTILKRVEDAVKHPECRNPDYLQALYKELNTTSTSEGSRGGGPGQ